MTALVVLAAGASRRFGRPKALEPVGPGGELLLDYAVYDALAARASAVVLVIRPESEAALRDHLAARAPIIPRFVHQPPPDAPGRSKPWGTGHAILVALRAAGDTCVVLNADDFYGQAAVRSAFQYAWTLDPRALQGAVAGYRVGGTLSAAGGVSRAQLESYVPGQISAITELMDVRRDGDEIIGRTVAGEVRRVPPEARVSMNLWVLTPAFVPGLERDFDRFLEAHGTDPDQEFLITEAVTRAIRDRDARIDMLAVGDTWFGLTFVRDRSGVVQRLARLTANGIYPSPLFGA